MTSIDRTQAWQTIKQDDSHWDLIIVGGGITGVGILREAARLGLKSLLIEQQDFAWGTSSRSSKMVHGGLRYIAQGDLKLTKHSAQERERLIAEAPGLVARLGYIFPIRKGQIPGKLALNSLLKIYDKLAGIKSQQSFSAKQLLQRVPGLNPDKLKGASYYTDAVTDDSRLVLRVLHEALQEQTCAINYCRAESLLYEDNGQVNGITLHNMVNNELQNVRCKVVINATGAWVDYLREPVSHERTIRPLRGSHIIIPHALAPVEDALTLFHPRDKRAVFIFPWENSTVIGTTDLDHHHSLDLEPSISQDEVDYLLTLVQQQFPQSGINRNSIISTYAGVRPVISKDRHKAPSKEKRDHQVWIDQGMVSVSGGKLTTFRLIARDTINAAIALINRDSPTAAFSTTPGTTSNRKESIIARPSITPEHLKLADIKLAERLIGCYGNHAENIVLEAKQGELDRIANTRFCLAEIRWSARNESVVYLDDLLLRRSRIGLLLKDGAVQLLPQLEQICVKELGWDDAQWAEQVARYVALWQQHYYLPNAS